MRKLNVAAVSYLNTKPFLYGIENSLICDKISLHLDYPAAIAQQLKNGEADLALIPVAEIRNIPDARVITDYCIGADGPVGSVCLYSDVPIERIKEIFLDYQSRTSVQLLRILLTQYFKVSPALLPSYPGYEGQLEHETAGLVIGDRTFEMAGRYSCIYDLSEAWKAMTGLPFVFAAWVSRTELSAQFITELNDAFRLAFECIDEVVAHYQPMYPHCDVKKYLTEQISYTLDARKREGLNTFLTLIRP